MSLCMYLICLQITKLRGCVAFLLQRV
ncbi:hypothetical protein Taro_055458 [Colocasia esculenta]|uniref:Uncharacterized protein n=1 Tax=Colocasia esculenta TaxID=4460 RepID=A0A843XT05_COLES|nr:hypothetical protein [Colocasia esculenta]